MKKILSALAALCLVIVPVSFPVEHYHGHSATLLTAEAKQEMVYFNTKTYKYHSQDCVWAQRCTRNCILITLSEARSRGGIPCKVCGG